MKAARMDRSPGDRITGRIAPVGRLRGSVSGLLHLAAAAAAAAGLAALLVISRGGLQKELTLLVYGVSLVLMFSASATYHLVRAKPHVMVWLRRLDHAAIYFLIAGSYTPVCSHFFSGFWQKGLLYIVWGMALVGAAVKIFTVRAPRWITAGIYLVMGWICIFAIREMLQSMPPAALAWLIAGGLFYSVGAVVYIAEKPDFFPGLFGFHELWHIFVILGALCHYILVAVFIAPAV